MKNLIRDRFVTLGKGFCVSTSALYTCPLDERGGGEVCAALKSPKDGVKTIPRRLVRKMNLNDFWMGQQPSGHSMLFALPI